MFALQQQKIHIAHPAAIPDVSLQVCLRMKAKNWSKSRVCAQVRREILSSYLRKAASLAISAFGSNGRELGLVPSN